jgi:membrane-associated HD superfamily phosphohydrolase
VSCVAPAIITALYVSPATKTTESKWALGGVALFTIALVILIVMRSLVKKYISKVPYTLTAFIAMLVVLLLMVCIKRIIDDAITIFFFGVIGAAFGFAFEMTSSYFKMRASDEDLKIKRRNEK